MDVRAIKSCSQNKSSKMRRSVSNKTYLEKENNKFLITINVMGSAGPIRFVVNGDDEADAVIEIALKLYGHEGRLPILGTDISSLFLYSANAGFEALKPWEAIGSLGVRNFVLCKKETKPSMSEARSDVIGRKGSGWRACLPP